MAGVLGTTACALDACRTLLALAQSPYRLRLFAAVSWQCLLDDHVPVPNLTPDKAPPPVIAIRLSECGQFLAWADDMGGLRAFGIGAGDGRRTALRHLFSVQLVRPATALVWRCSSSGREAPQLASGDARGEVRLWRVSDGTSHMLLPADGSPVVQLDCAARDAPQLLASSYTRTTLVPLMCSVGAESAAEARPIGKAKRDGPFGACILDAPLDVCPPAAMVAARPGRRMWLIGADGTVLSTLKFASEVGIVSSAGKDGDSSGHGGVPATLGFGRLAVATGLGLLLSWGGGDASTDGCISLIDLEGVRVLDAKQVAPPVHSVAPLGLGRPSGRIGVTRGSSTPPAPSSSMEHELEVLVLHDEAPRRLSRLHLGYILLSTAGAPHLPLSPPRGEHQDWEASPPPPPPPPPQGSPALSAALSSGSSQIQQPQSQLGASPDTPPAVTPPLSQRRKRPSIVREISSGSSGASSGTVGSVAQRGSRAGPSPSPNSMTVPREGQPLPAVDTTPIAVPTAGRASAGTPNAPLSWSQGVALALVDNPAPADGIMGALDRGSLLHVSNSSRLSKVGEWFLEGYTARALLALLMLGWRRRWADGQLQQALERHAGRLSREQWPALLEAARSADEPRAESNAPGRVTGQEERRRKGCETSSGANESASLLLLRAMLAVQPAGVCLGMLRREPRLAERLPPAGYVELLRAMQREMERYNDGPADDE
jgi:hypothetical protein